MRISCNNCVAVGINGHASHETGCTGHFTLTGHHGLKYWQYRVWAVDVWGNARDGFEVNDRSHAGFVTLPAEPSDAHIIKGLKRRELIGKYRKISAFTCDGDDNLIMIDYKPTGEPVYQLERM